MGQLDALSQMTLQQVINYVWARVAENNGLRHPQTGAPMVEPDPNYPGMSAKERFYLRHFMSEDWDGHTESDYALDWSSDGDQTTSGHTFEMQPVQKFEAAVVAGWHHADVGATLNHLEIWVGTAKRREYFGYVFAQQEYGLTLFLDPSVAMRNERLRIIPNTTSGGAAVHPFPFGFVILQR